MKIKCKQNCKSSSSSFCCDTSSSSYCSKSSKNCCEKYPKCKCLCITNKCAPIYYPNNYVGQYPCGTFPNPCETFLNPCGTFPNPCGTSYTSYNGIQSSTTLIATSPNVLLYAPSNTTTTITLPAISSLGCCKYNKTFIITNVGSNSGILNINTNSSSTDIFSNNISTQVLNIGNSITLYSVYIPNNASYWVVANLLLSS